VKTFKTFLSEASIRQGLPHITTMDHDQFHRLTLNNKVHVNDVTEKTDGQSFKFGHDEQGFYTQSTGSGDEKMRSHEDYEKRARRRAEETGKPLDLTAAKAFAHVHKTLQANKKLTDHLAEEHKKRGEEVAVRGESFYKPWGKPSESKVGEIKFVGTSYDPSHMGKVGKIVIHSKLPENQGHDVEHFKKHLSDENINFDDDKIDHPKGHVDVTEERQRFDSLNHELLNSRTTKTNKEAKQYELDKFAKIKEDVSKKVDSHIKGLQIRPKWGSGTEGAVIHPSDKNPHAPRFKVTSSTFRAYRASDAAKNFKKAPK
jgi:hypothetical protein